MKNTTKITEMLTKFASKLELGSNPHIKELLAIEAEFAAVVKSVGKMFATLKESVFHTIYVGCMKNDETLSEDFIQLWGEYLEQSLDEDGVRIVLRLPLERVFEVTKWMNENPHPIIKN